jgi:hypothetical protein
MWPLLVCRAGRPVLRPFVRAHGYTGYGFKMRCDVGAEWDGWTGLRECKGGLGVCNRFLCPFRGGEGLDGGKRKIAVR